MAGDHRVKRDSPGRRPSADIRRPWVSEPTAGHRPIGRSLRRRVCATVLPAIIGICGGCTGQDVDQANNVSEASQDAGLPKQSDAPVVDTVPIIVTLAAEPDGTDIAATRARLMGRIEERISAEQFAAIRTFEMLPAIALAAQPDLIAWLLSQPEVASIEPDRTHVPISDVEPDTNPVVPATAPHPSNGPGESDARDVTEGQPQKDA